MANPEVSVVMSVYNDAANLPRTLRSVLTQESCDFEFIAIDDGSSDSSGQILDEWAKTDARLRVIHQENTGLTRALMRGCSEARGRFIARQDAGDISLPGRLSDQANFLRQDSSLAFVGCGFDVVGPGRERLTDFFTAQRSAEEGLKDREGRVVPFPHHGTVMFRTAAYVEAGGYRAEFYFAQDIDLWSRLIEQGGWGYAPRVLYEVRFDLDGISARHREAQQALRQLILESGLLRRSGRSDADVLRRAAAIRPRPIGPGQRRPRHNHRVAAAYFVGSCLVQQQDPRARKYFLEALHENPFHLKSWYKLIRSAALPWKAPG
jgi:glycosyltransferase involved in cell wall biosynthesis